MESAFGVDHGEVSKSLRGLGGALKDVARYTAHRAAKSHPAQMGKLNMQIAGGKAQLAGMKVQNKVLDVRLRRARGY